MNFNVHSNLEGRHAFLSGSKVSWLNYDDDKLVRAWRNDQAKECGTILHEFAAQCIKLNQRLPEDPITLNMYVNDAIGYKMRPEQPLYYSENCFGTADSICFRKNILRIHDLKTGTTTVHIEQLYIYAALFCLEYHYDPHEIEMEFRIYQNNDILTDVPDPDDISEIMEKIKRFDKILKDIQYKENEA